MTRRFDRTPEGRKIHIQLLGAMCHFDYRRPGAHSYEQAVGAIRQLGMGMPAVREQYRRAIFNVAATNQDDHVKNISFLMERSGEWRLSPAYDVTYSCNPVGLWTRDHQMSLAGKVDDFTREDLLTFARSSGMNRHEVRRILEEVFSAVGRWRQFADEAGVDERDASRIEKAHRMVLDRSRAR